MITSAVMLTKWELEMLCWSNSAKLNVRDFNLLFKFTSLLTLCEIQFRNYEHKIACKHFLKSLDKQMVLGIIQVLMDYIE